MEVDPSQYAVPPCGSPTEGVWIWTHRRGNVEAYRRAGYGHVDYLPLAADPAVRRELELTAEERERYGAPVSFVGNSMLSGVDGFRARFLEQHARWRGSRAGAVDAAFLERLLAAQRAEGSRFVVPSLLDAEAPGFRESALAAADAPDPAMLAGEIAAAERRLTYAANLASFGIRVWGDAGWRAIVPQGVRHMGSARHNEELTRIYNASDVNLDIGRIYQPDIVTMRVFDALCAGGFVLAEHSEALEEVLVDGREVASYRTLAELKEKARYYLDRPNEAREIAARGRERVHREHTIAHRVGRMLAAAV